MRLLNAKLRQVCQHAELEIDFMPGLTLIVGPNGAGKSNLVNTIRASLTNDFGPMGGTKSDNIRRLKPEGVPSFIETSWEVPIGVMTIRRGLASCRSALIVNGEERISGREDDITAEVLSLSGLTAGKINDFLFADQDKLLDVIGRSKARRAELFQSLCGIETMNTVDRYLRDHVTGDRAVIGAFELEELDKYRKARGILKAEIKKLRETLVSQKQQMLTEAELETHRQIVSNCDRVLELTNDLKLARDRVRKNRDLQVQATSDAEEAASVLVQATEAAEEAEKRFREIDARLSNATRETRDAKAYQAAIQTAKSPAPVAPVVVELDEAAVQAECYELSSRIKRAKEILELADSDQAIECDKCGSPIASVREHAEHYRSDLEELPPRLASLQQQLKDHRTQQRAMATYREDLKVWTSERDAALKVVAATKEQYPKKPPQVIDVASLTSERAAADQHRKIASAALQKAREAHQTVMSRLTAAETREETDKTAIEELQRRLESYPTVSASMADESRAIIAQQSKLSEEFHANQGTMQSKRTEALLTARRLRSLKREQENLVKLDTWVKCAENARNVLKKDRLPARLVAGMLGRTTAIVNQYLEKLGVSYRVEAEVREFAFEAIHVDGTREPASRLSVGQRTCLAIAFWLARAEVFVGSLPFFCLDEPTAHIDSSRIANVSDLFGVLASQLYADGRQGIVITHHAELARVATHTVHLQ